MRVKMILPALTEATSPFFRPIKYSLFPPLGLATLAAYLGDDDDVTICDEHVEKLRLDDEPDLVVIQVYILRPGARTSSPTTIAGAESRWCSAGCMSPPFPTKQPPTRITYSWVQAKTRGLSSSATLDGVRRCPVMFHAIEPWRPSRPSGAT